MESSDLQHKCGIAAVHSSRKQPHAKEQVVYALYKMLLNLQTRGQLSAGISTYNDKRSQILDTYKDLGMVNEVFKTSFPVLSMKLFKKYAGDRGIGHVRYATCGDESKDLAHPFERQHSQKWKWFSFGFNGNLANYAELVEQFPKDKEYYLRYSSDTEMMMHHIAKGLKGEKRPDLLDVFGNVSKEFDGAYNITYLDANGRMAVVRDPLGFRPLVYGRANGMTMAASESNALFNCGVMQSKSLLPGEMMLVDGENVEIKRYAPSPRKAHCMFEWIYFANVASTIDDRSVYLARLKLGQELAKRETENISVNHIVVSVPDSAKPAGDSFAFELGIPSKEGLVRNRFVGRTFIQGSGREDRIRNKFTALRSILKGKKVLLVDDSIVRGSTSRKLVEYVKRVGGAKEVHLRVSCPPIFAPCFYGIDMSTVGELIAPKYVNNVHEEISEAASKKIAQDLGADSLIYNDKKAVVKAISLPEKDLCMACLNGNYPTACGKQCYIKALTMQNKAKGKEAKRTYE
ncbi:amidophosphoribosyltransferase [Candidatus Woesearchaeota archaeon]|nr:amidophosphoribosyltransferase [Candidatus Woesearchaeota archaeon]